jgi:hypothetical protein
MSTTLVISALIAVAAIAVAGFTALKFLRKSRSRVPHTRHGRLNEIANHSSPKQAEIGPDLRRETVEDFHLQQFASAEHARYAEVHAQYAETNGGTVTEADPGLSDVLSMSGVLVGDEQCGADIVVGSLQSPGDCVIHELALRIRKRPGEFELRRALNRYRALVAPPQAARRNAA